MNTRRTPPRIMEEGVVNDGVLIIDQGYKVHVVSPNINNEEVIGALLTLA